MVAQRYAVVKIACVILLLSSPCVASTALVAAPVVQKERIVKTMHLQSFFHSTLGWRLTVYQATRDGFDSTLRDPVRACFTRPPTDGGESYTSCHDLYAPGYTPGIGRYACQRFDIAKLEMLPGLRGPASRPSLVIRAHYASGTNGKLECLFVWTFEPPRAKRLGAVGFFTKAFESDTDQKGQQRFFTSGPLAGTFVTADQVYQPSAAEPNLETPMRFQISVYAPDTFGYMNVLTFMSIKRYPSNNSGRGTPDPIELLTPVITRALHAIYPAGLSSLLERKRTKPQ